ncbi:MAG: sulfotransferase domain-containing protein [Chlamydiales bacterium]
MANRFFLIYLFGISLWLISMVNMSQASIEESWAPNYLLIGAQKSGTTALFQYINMHPLVINKTGEIHFFDNHFNQGLNWYKNHFSKRPSPEYVIGDKSPYYLFHPLAPQRVAATFPNVKIIIILRNPVDRAYSQYWMNINLKEETLSFEEAIKAEPKRLTGERKKILENPAYNSHRYQFFSYLSRGIYVNQIKRWLSYFPRDQILIISSKDLRDKTDEVMNTVYTFLGLPPHILKRYINKHTDYPPMDKALREQLKEYFQPYNQELEALLGMQFKWD